ncbi:trans-sialidase, putative, partial [Trypanosoma cruzi marinkellei]
KPLLKKETLQTEDRVNYIFPGAGSGVLMENGMLVFPVGGVDKAGKSVSMIVYSRDNGSSWTLSEGMSPADCFGPVVTEWERGQIFMIAHCEHSQRVYESRDMGRNWTEAVGVLPGVWVNSQSEVSWDVNLHVDALISATIEGRKLMLYPQTVYALGEGTEKALYLCVTDNNRSFSVGPLAVENAEKGKFDNTLLYSDGNLYIAQEKHMTTHKGISLARLTEELNTIKLVLSTWAELDAFFSKSSVPTAGLVGFLSNAASDRTWIDEYRCVNATVTKAAKVAYGFKFTGSGSGATWPMKSRGDKNHYGFVNQNFTIVAMVIIHLVPNVSTSLLGAGLGDGERTKFIGLSYGKEKKWETVFQGTKTASNSTWEPEREYLVALVLQGGNKGSVYVDGVLVGSSATLTTPDTRGREITHFYIGGDEGESGSHVTVKNVLLYNQLLDVGEIKTPFKSIAAKLKAEYGDGSMHEGVSRVLVVLLGLCAFAFLC